MKPDNQRPRDEAMEHIENYIIEHKLEADDRLPSERAMCEMWDFNRSTLRSAIRQLLLEGKIYSKSGSGTYVAKGKLVRNLQDVAGFYHLAKAAGRKVTTKVIRKDICVTTKEIGKKMKLPLGHRLLRLERLRYLDGISVMYETAYIDAERFPGIEDFDFNEISLYQVLKKQYHVTISGGDEKLSITYCDEKEASFLGTEPGAPVIYQSGITEDDQSVIFEYFKELTRSEYVCFASELTRR